MKMKWNLFLICKPHISIGKSTNNVSSFFLNWDKHPFSTKCQLANLWLTPLPVQIASFGTAWKCAGMHLSLQTGRRTFSHPTVFLAAPKRRRWAHHNHGHQRRFITDHASLTASYIMWLCCMLNLRGKWKLSMSFGFLCEEGVIWRISHKIIFKLWFIHR